MRSMTGGLMSSWSNHLAIAVALILLLAVDAATLLQPRERQVRGFRELRAGSNDATQAGAKEHAQVGNVVGLKERPVVSRARSMLLQIAHLCSGPRVQNFLGRRPGQEDLQADKDYMPSEQHPAFILMGQAPDVVIQEPAQSQQWYNAWLQALLLRFILLAYVGLVCTIAYFYFRQKPVREDAMPELEDSDGLSDWKYGICDCCSAPSICFWSCCCPAIRWADTLGMTGLLGFWLAFAIYLGVDFLGSLAFDFLFWILLAVICAGFRQEMRIKFHMKKQGGATYCLDFLLYCCCSCCVMVQEARQVEEACKVGMPVEVPTVQVVMPAEVPTVQVHETT